MKEEVSYDAVSQGSIISVNIENIVKNRGNGIPNNTKENKEEGEGEKSELKDQLKEIEKKNAQIRH